MGEPSRGQLAVIQAAHASGGAAAVAVLAKAMAEGGGGQAVANAMTMAGGANTQPLIPVGQAVAKVKGKGDGKQGKGGGKKGKGKGPKPNAEAHKFLDQARPEKPYTRSPGPGPGCWPRSL